jgi:hypothetical protein
MNILILDYSTWRCGGATGDNVLGKGLTNLCNNEGFMCCLGQFSLQLDPNLTKEDIIHKATPWGVYNGDNPKLVVPPKQMEILAGEVTAKAIGINDNENTTPVEKISKLKSLFGEVGYEIRVINQPE